MPRDSGMNHAPPKGDALAMHPSIIISTPVAFVEMLRVYKVASHCVSHMPSLRSINPSYTDRFNTSSSQTCPRTPNPCFGCSMTCLTLSSITQTLTAPALLAQRGAPWASMKWRSMRNPGYPKSALRRESVPEYS